MRVLIAIPIYKATLNYLEEIALNQMDKILAAYDKIFIAPESLEFSYGDRFKNYRVERYHDEYFSSIESYSKLMLSETFYQRFSDYTYMLIYQTDAFVFSDQLIKFCERGFDYIGAPIPGFAPHWHELQCFVGNGGLSLRKIQSVLACIRHYQPILKHNNFSEAFYKWEDLFFAYCAMQKDLKFRVPNIKEAVTFSVDQNVRHAYQEIAKTGILPFGCHGWYKVNYHKWKPIIENYGYILPNENEVDYINTFETRKEKIGEYLFRRIMRSDNRRAIKNILYKYIDCKKSYSIYGGGRDGKECIALMMKCEINPLCIYDSNYSTKKSSFDICIKKPSSAELSKKDSILIIATKRYEKEISKALENIGFKENKDYLLYSKIKKHIIDNL